MLPAGDALSTRRRSPMAVAATVGIARRLAQAGRGRGLAVHVVHYRFRGWNGGHAHPVEDAHWAAGQVMDRYGDVPIALVGVDMGGRAALRAADHPAVESVVAIAPWLPSVTDAGLEPVKQLAGRKVLIVHGTDDWDTAPEVSYQLAERAKKVSPDICRFEVHTAGHALAHRRHDVTALTADFVLGSLGLCLGYSRPVADALVAPPPLGLRMPLATGFAADGSR